jgi:hypothetical protein
MVTIPVFDLRLLDFIEAIEREQSVVGIAVKITIELSLPSDGNHDLLGQPECL